MGILIAQLQVTDDSNKTITGTWEFDRDGYGTLITPHGTAFPDDPTTNEFFLRTDLNELYYYDGASWESLGGTVVLDGYVQGPTPASSTDNAIVRWDGTTGRLLQNSNVTIDDSGNISTSGNITVSGTVDGVDVSNHNARHIRGGADEIDGDKIDIDFTPTNYTPTTSPAEVTNVDELTAHLAGIDGYLANISPGVNDVVLVTDGYSKNYNTISDALDDAVSGNVVIVGPGTYAESFNVPAGVKVRAAYGTGNATISGTVTMAGSNSLLWSFNILVPNDGYGVIVSDGADEVVISQVVTIGQGSGVGFYIASNQHTILDRLQHFSGNLTTIIDDNSSGLTTINGLLGHTGTITNGMRCRGLGETQFASYYTSEMTGTNGLLIEDGYLYLSDSRIIGFTNACKVEDGYSLLDVRATVVNGDTYDLNIDSSVTSGFSLYGNARGRINKLFASPEWIENNSGVSLILQDDDPGSETTRFFGDVTAGIHEKGRNVVAGQGSEYTRGMVVFTTDSTATGSTDGGNFINVTTEASSASGSTFSFQGTAANHTILMCSQLQDVSGYLRIWGFLVKMGSQRAVVAGGGVHESFAIEYWDGSNWTEVGAMASNYEFHYRYANELFQRADTTEEIRLGLSPDTSWVTKTINTITGYWLRIRIKANLTTAPVFEQFHLHPSFTRISEDGTLLHFGTSRYKRGFTFSGNSFGESGGVSGGSFSVGSGGLPTGWTHYIKNSILNGNGDAIYVQLSIEKGVCTGCPFYINFTLLAISGGNDVDFVCSFLAREVEGVLEADSTGGIVPVERTAANTHTIVADAGQSDSKTINITSNKLQTVQFGPFDIDDYYENDFIFVRLEMDDDGPSNVNLGVLGVEFIGTLWTPGENI